MAIKAKLKDPHQYLADKPTELMGMWQTYPFPPYLHPIANRTWDPDLLLMVVKTATKIVEEKLPV
jgi:hypothetical protein